MSSTRDRHWESWSEDDFQFVHGIVETAQVELAIAAARSLKPNVRDRASRVELVLRAVCMMLRDPSIEHTEYIKNKIQLGIGYYDLEVIDSPSHYQGVREDD